MGRGRQKAKDAKIARQLKYSTPETDLQALERELVSGKASAPVDVEEDESDEYLDRWADDDED